MRAVVTSQEMKNCDKNTVEKFHMPAMVLMERAAIAVVEEMRNHKMDFHHVLVVAGGGNNGGDGLAAARILYLSGVKVTICLLGDRAKASEQTKQQVKILESYGVIIHNTLPNFEYTTIVDAILGTGGGRNVEGIYEAAINQINQMPAKVIAVDVPSGIHTDTGKILGCAVKADLTVTFAFEKRGCILYPGAEYAGELVVKDIGITKEAFLQGSAGCFSFTKEDLKLLPSRKNDSNKGSFGKMLVIAGSMNMSGAAYLSAKAAYRTGAGLVKILTIKENREVLQSSLPEALLTTYDSCMPDIKIFKEAVEWADIVLIGPGLGVNRTEERLLQAVLQWTKKPIVIDADGINILSRHMEWLEQVDSPVILTPHLKEMSRMVKKEVGELKEDLIKNATEFVSQYPVTLVMKDARTIVAKKGKALYINRSGNNGMATAGAGDVLAGVIGGLMAQGADAFLGAALGVFVHGLSGDLQVQKKGRFGLMAGDIIDGLPEILGN